MPELLFLTRPATHPTSADAGDRNGLDHVDAFEQTTSIVALSVWIETEKRLPKLHGVSIFNKDGDNLARGVGGYFVEYFHGFDDAYDRLPANVVTYLHKRRRLRVRSGIVGPDHRALHINKRSRR